MRKNESKSNSFSLKKIQKFTELRRWNVNEAPLGEIQEFSFMHVNFEMTITHLSIDCRRSIKYQVWILKKLFSQLNLKWYY